MSVDILGTSWDQCRRMVQYIFTSTETRRLVRTDSSGRPPRLSHSSWTMIKKVDFDMLILYLGIPVAKGWGFSHTSLLSWRKIVPMCINSSLYLTSLKHRFVFETKMLFNMIISWGHRLSFYQNIQTIPSRRRNSKNQIFPFVHLP